MDDMTRPDSNQTQNALPDLLGKLMSDPGLMQRMGEIVKTASDSHMQAGEDTSAKLGTSAPPLDGLSALLSNPALLEKLPSMLATVGPLLAGASSPIERREEKSSASQRDALLLALKPFLSQGRREAVDSILRLARLGEVLQQLPAGKERS